MDRNTVRLHGQRGQDNVALRTEGVDRNVYCAFNLRFPKVALRTEGVDRNGNDDDSEPPDPVALRTEGVDRNLRLKI